MKQCIWRKRSGLESQVVDNEILILDSKTCRFFRLNRVGGLVWELCNGASAQAIAEAISRDFEVSVADALTDVRAYLKQLAKSGLVEAVKSTATPRE